MMEIEQSGLNSGGEQTPVKKTKKLWQYTVGLIIAIIIIFSATILISSDSSEYWISRIPVFGKLLVSSSNRELAGESKDRINVLLLGMGGKNHDGGYLADTIILSSLQPSSKKAVLFSLPRDLSIPLKNGGTEKINAINAYAEAKKENGSLATAEELSSILNIPVDYYLRVDFDGFINIIDLLGGIDVNVENTLEDYEYPIRGQEDNPNYYSRFEHLYIEKGWQKMDGALALKYARSRHAIGKEGSDFARSRRQQIIISAVKDKLMQKQNLLNPVTIAKIVGQLNEHVSTNLKVWEVVRFWDLFKDINKDDISNEVFDDGPTGHLIGGRSDIGSYILLPKTGNFLEIQGLFANPFDSKQDQENSGSNSAVKPAINPINEEVSVDIKNGTFVGGLATEASAELKKYNFTVSRVGNASRRDIKDSVIYDLTYGEKTEPLKTMQAITQASSTTIIPGWLVSDIKAEIKANPSLAQPDFILILGENFSKAQ